jgi:excisionase family DNA binding protein
MTERIKATKAAEVLGVSKRLVTLMASRGDLPGAAKIGSLWTFDKNKLQEYVTQKENECLKIKTKILFAGTGNITSEPMLRVNSSRGRYEQAMSKLRGLSETSSLKKRKIGPGAEIVKLRGSMQ